jgi:pentatricopeptide repeat protein
MKSQGILPDEVLFNSLLDGCAKAGAADLAHQVYSEMRKVGIKPSNVTFSILIKLYGRNKQIERVLKVLEEMKLERVSPGMIVYTCVIQACIKVKNIQKALQIYEEMKQTGVSGDKVTFNTLVNGCVFARQLEKAVSVTLDSFSLRVMMAQDVYGNLMNALKGCRDQRSAGWLSQIGVGLKALGVDMSTAEPRENVHRQTDTKTTGGRRFGNVLGEKQMNV